MHDHGAMPNEASQAHTIITLRERASSNVNMAAHAAYLISGVASILHRGGGVQIFRDKR